MRFPIDSCVWRPVVDQLRAAGHDVDTVHEWAGDPGDDAILEHAAGEGRVLVLPAGQFEGAIREAREGQAVQFSLRDTTHLVVGSEAPKELLAPMTREGN